MSCVRVSEEGGIPCSLHRNEGDLHVAASVNLLSLQRMRLLRDAWSEHTVPGDFAELGAQRATVFSIHATVARVSKGTGVTGAHESSRSVM